MQTNVFTSTCQKCKAQALHPLSQTPHFREALPVTQLSAGNLVRRDWPQIGLCRACRLWGDREQDSQYP